MPFNLQAIGLHPPVAIQDMPGIPDAFKDTLLATKEAEQTCSLKCYKGTTILYLTLGRPADWRLANWCMSVKVSNAGAGKTYIDFCTTIHHWHS